MGESFAELMRQADEKKRADEAAAARAVEQLRLKREREEAAQREASQKRAAAAVGTRPLRPRLFAFSSNRIRFFILHIPNSPSSAWGQTGRPKDRRSAETEHRQVETRGKAKQGCQRPEEPASHARY